MLSLEQPSWTAKRSRLLAEVPPFHAVAVKLLKLVGNPNCSLGEVVALLRTDAVFTAEVLRLANSSLLGHRYEVKTVLHALGFLGLERINTLLLTVAMRGLVDRRRSILTHSCWRHNLATALICQRMAKVAGLEPERAYIAGLIHDIGLLALLRVFPEYERASNLWERYGPPLLELEREMFGIDHGEAGRWLLSQWGCPIELQNVAASHENHATVQGCDGILIGLVGTSSQLADLMKMSVYPTRPQIESSEVVAWFPEAAREQILDGLPELTDWVVTRVNEIEVSLGV
ncbi:MAG TPA: HDOD domain-containing protein [Verrucomicrobiae bacterium]|nr:HDOD domain-containing protein [Verrucomicrobiae bacterium]